MAQNSRIEWTDSSWQPVSGCSRKSSGCENCYAERMAGTRLRHQARYAGLTRMTTNGPRWTGVTRFNEEELLAPLGWRKPRRVFVCSMADLFHETVPFEWIDKVFAVMALCPQHTFQVLTKRPERMAEYTKSHLTMYQALGELHLSYGTPSPNALDVSGRGWAMWPLSNVWIGTSCEDQKTADERIPHLLQCPAAVRFLSCEPLLGEIELTELTDSQGQPFDCLHAWKTQDGISWVIVGGESGPKARPCVIGHIRSLVRQCQAASVPCFVKQLGSNPVNREGEPHPISDHHDMAQFPEDLRIRSYPRCPSTST